MVDTENSYLCTYAWWAWIFLFKQTRLVVQIVSCCFYFLLYLSSSCSLLDKSWESTFNCSRVDKPIIICYVQVVATAESQRNHSRAMVITSTYSYFSFVVSFLFCFSKYSSFMDPLFSVDLLLILELRRCLAWKYWEKRRDSFGTLPTLAGYKRHPCHWQSNLIAI